MARRTNSPITRTAATKASCPISTPRLKSSSAIGIACWGNPTSASAPAKPKPCALGSNGSFTYTPNANFNGTDTFTYTASDGPAVSNIATVTITVGAVNDAPVAVDDAALTTEEAAVSGSVLGNDTDTEGTPLTATLGVGPANGLLTLGSNGSFTYTPNANFNGTDTFTYTASDGPAVSNIATVTITVGAVNDAPVAVDDAALTTEEAAVSGNVLTNDTDAEGTPLTAVLDANPVNGTVVLALDGSFSYTPNANFNGPTRSPTRPATAVAVSNVGDGDDHGGRGQRCAGGGRRLRRPTTEDTAVSGNVLDQ